MKKVFFFLILLGLFSCAKRKDWECNCSISGFEEGVHTKTFKWKTEKKAKEKCNIFGMQMAGDLSSYSCNIK